MSAPDDQQDLVAAVAVLWLEIRAEWERLAAFTIALLADVCDDASAGRVGTVDASALAALSMR